MMIEVDGTSCTCRQDRTSEEDLVGSKIGVYEEFLPDLRTCVGSGSEKNRGFT